MRERFIEAVESYLEANDLSVYGFLKEQGYDQKQVSSKKSAYHGVKSGRLKLSAGILMSFENAIEPADRVEFARYILRTNKNIIDRMVDYLEELIWNNMDATTRKIYKAEKRKEYLIKAMEVSSEDV